MVYNARTDSYTPKQQMDKYVIYWGWPAYNDWERYDSLAEAMHAADDGACYTQNDIEIYKVSALEKYGNEAVPIARRRWWGIAYDPEEDDDDRADVICIGGGYYGAWRVRADAWDDPEDSADLNRWLWEYCSSEDY